jgi:hypothetical protein
VRDSSEGPILKECLVKSGASRKLAVCFQIHHSCGDLRRDVAWFRQSLILSRVWFLHARLLMLSMPSDSALQAVDVPYASLDLHK